MPDISVWGAAMRISISTAKLVLFSTVYFLAAATVWPRDVPAIVSTDWLLRNLDNPRVVLLDIRTAAQYEKGHIPGSLNMPLNLWAITDKGLSLELPSDETIRDLLGKSGIGPATIVVVVTRTETDFTRSDATRVAWTCMVGGVRNVAVLDGGYSKWAKDNRVVSTDSVESKAVAYTGTIDRSSVVSKSYVLSKIGKSIIVDTRKPEDYFGKTSKPGHIKSAVDMPTPWIFTPDGTFIKEEVLQSIASGVLGADKSREVILYCDVGGFASTWWFVLTQVLEYRNVKLYDGSMEEWIKDPSAPVSAYCWN
jgi:thiosulfate/3-mercaptopyruvate sulfurtransferase